MHSSISPSDARKAEVSGAREGALPPGLQRRVRPPRPGAAGPDARHPLAAVGQMGVCVFVAVTLLTAAWEWNARTNIGLRAGDIGDSPQAWAEQRRLADAAPVTLVGDSRILFDTDLDRFQQLTGVRPVQTAIVGTNARALLESYANDPNFHGLLVLGLADLSYFRPVGVGLGGSISKLGEERQTLAAHGAVARPLSPAEPRFHGCGISAQHLDDPVGPRAAQRSYGPYDDVWKISETFDRRQYFMWDRIETDPYLRAHARHAWDVFKGPPLPPFIARNVIARSAEAVRRIRARGGDVIFIRPPSAPELRATEDKRLPRARAGTCSLPERRRRASTPTTCRRHRTSSSRMVAPQPQMRDRLHRRLCAAADAAHATPETARRCSAAAHPRRLRPAGLATAATRKAA